MIPKIEIKTDGVRAKILIDGTDISGCVKSYKIEQKAGEPATMEIDAFGLDMSIDAKVMPALPAPWTLYYEPKYKEDYDGELSNAEPSPQEPSQE